MAWSRKKKVLVIVLSLVVLAFIVSFTVTKLETPSGARIELRSDSELLIDGMRFRVFRWQRFGWRNSRGFELQHQELWRELLELSAPRTIRWQWIRGHNGHPIQSRADALAYQAARAATIQERIAA